MMGHDVLEFAMHHPNNLPSDYVDYFVPYVEYRQEENGKSRQGYTEKLRIAKNFVFNRQAVKQLNRLVKKKKPDIAHLHNIYHQITPAIISLLKKSGIKTILSLHDYKLLCPVYNMLQHGKICRKCQGSKFWHVVSGRCESRSVGRSMLLAVEAYWHYWARSYEGIDLFLAPSKFMATMMARYRLPPSKIRVLPNGVDCEQVVPSIGDGHYALFVGRISREKGVALLLEAFQQLGWPVPLKVVGVGPLFEQYRKQYPQVEFAGYQTGKELEKIFRQASFVIVPSSWYENCSMVVLEAMVHGKPVIGSRIGGIPEQIEDQVTGLLFTCGDLRELMEKINLLVKNNDLRRQLGLRARKKVEREYSFANHCRQLMAIYHHVHSVTT